MRNLSLNDFAQNIYFNSYLKNWEPGAPFSPVTHGISKRGRFENSMRLKVIMLKLKSDLSDLLFLPSKYIK